ncbi:MAG: hypothetical protein R6V02_06860 [Candidatus Aminicenantes bacterium]
MSKPFLEIAGLDKKEQDQLLKDIEAKLEEKKKAGLFTEREVKEIENMEIKPLPDIQDVQSVYEDLIGREKK